MQPTLSSLSDFPIKVITNERRSKDHGKSMITTSQLLVGPHLLMRKSL
ncbi:hypothetical protein LINPERHAP2_LOCUS16810 [Linum perenne]